MRLQVSVKTPNGVETASLEAGHRYEFLFGDGRVETGIFEQASWSPMDGRVWLYLRLPNGVLVGFDERNLVDVTPIHPELQALDPIEQVEAYRG